MPDLKKEQYTKAEVAELIRKEAEEINEKVEVAELVAEMTDAEKSLYKSLSGEAKDEFLFMDSAQRADKVAKAQDSDPVVYTATDGTEYRKSAGEALISMAKGRDQDRKDLVELQKGRDEDRITKMAEVDLKYLPGELATRVALIKSVESITDETQRTAAMDALKAQNASMMKAMEEFGTSEGLTLVKGDAQEQLEGMAKTYQKDHPDVNSVDAYNKVAEANPDLYAKAVNGE